MIEKAIAYKNADKDFIINLKKLGLNEDEIDIILKKYKRKKFEDGGGGDGGGGDGGSSGSDSGGDGGDSGGDSGDSGSSASSDGGGDSGASGGVGGSDAAGDAGEATGDSPGVGGSGDSTSATGVGQGPGGEEGTGGVSAANAATEGAGVMSTLGNLARTAFNAYMSVSPIGILSNAISNISRGVTAPNDFSQATESVQSAAPSATNTGGGGITTIQSYAPLSNVSTGDNTQDAIRTRLENLLKVPTTQTVFQPQNINRLSNYTLADLTNFRGI